MALTLRHAAPALLVLGLAACGHNVNTIPPVLEGISLLGDTLWSVPVPIQGARERVTRLQTAREELNQSPGSFEASYDVARYTADIGRYTQAVVLFGDAAAMGGLDPRPFARRGELYLLLRRIDRAYSDLRTAERLFAGDALSDLQVTSSGDLQPRPWAYAIPNLLGIVAMVRGESRRAAEYFTASALQVQSLREAVHATLWFRASRPGTDFPSTLSSRFRSATNLMVSNAARGASGGGCPSGTGSMVDADLLCLVRGERLLAEGKRGEALAIFDLIRRRMHWSSPAHLVAEAATARLLLESEATTIGDRKASLPRAF